MVEKVKLNTANRAKSSVRGSGTATPKAPSISSSAPRSLQPLVDIDFIIEQTLLSGVAETEGEYFKNHEKYLGTLFRVTPRLSTSDTRPDLPLTSAHIDDLLVESSLRNDMMGTLTSGLVPSVLQGFRDSLRKFEEEFKDLGLGTTGVEIKGSKYGYAKNVGSDFKVNATLQTGKNLTVTEIKGVPTLNYKKEDVSMSDLLMNLGSVLNKYPTVAEKNIGDIYTLSLTKDRNTPRGLSGRTLLSGYENEPDPNTNVISLAYAFRETFGNKFDPTGKNRRIDSEENQKTIATNIFNFLKQDNNLAAFHKAITGNEPGLTGKESKDLNKKFKVLAKTPAARQIVSKGEQLFLQYVTEEGGTKKSFVAYLKSTFKYENTTVSLTPTNISFAYTDRFESEAIAKIEKAVRAAAKRQFDENVAKILKDTDVAKFLGTLEDLKELNKKTIASVGADISGSMPIGKIKIPNYTVKRKTSGSAFQSRIGSIRSLLQETRVKTPSMGDFVTDDTITALTKREMLRRMPIGPIGGPPKSSRVLTYRTGRFVDSVQVIADMRSKAMQYYYDPNYWIHEATSRNPRNLIGSSINSVTRSLFGKRFNLVKANQSL